MSKKQAKKAAAAARSREAAEAAKEASVIGALDADATATGVDERRVSKSGRPVYSPSTAEWVLFALALALVGTGISAFTDGDVTLGVIGVVVGVIALVCFVVLIVRHAQGKTRDN